MNIYVIGAGLAGCEAALVLARNNYNVTLVEQRPCKHAPAHHTSLPAELVCSNSLKSFKIHSAAGLLKHDLDILSSPLYACAMQARVKAGGALAVDREKFSQLVAQKIEESPYIQYIHEECTHIPQDAYVILAPGPLCSDKLALEISKHVESNLSFYDAAAPIVEADSLNFDKLHRQSRYEESGCGDYLNAFFTKEQYEEFVEELIEAPRVILKDFETKDLFQACQPVEEIARTGKDSLRFGTMKPVGLRDPITGKRPWAALQLRAENAEKTAYNLVGFQTNLTFEAQREIFLKIPGLEQAVFSRYGVMHRNTFINAPKSLTKTFAFKDMPQVICAGQITGTEGYTEAIFSGHIAALNIMALEKSLPPVILPKDTVFGALMNYATSPDTKDYQPLHVNFGLIELPQCLEGKKKLGKHDRFAAKSLQARASFINWIQTRHDLFSETVYSFALKRHAELEEMYVHEE